MNYKQKLQPETVDTTPIYYAPETVQFAQNDNLPWWSKGDTIAVLETQYGWTWAKIDLPQTLVNK